MKTISITALVLTTGFLTAGAFAETAPASPASAPASTAPAPVPVAAVAATPDQIVYAAQLPRVEDLTNVAAAQGLTIKQIVQTAHDVTISYQLANGQTRTISYRLLLAGNQMPVQPVQTVAPAPVVVVEPPPAVYYYDPYYYYGPWYPPVAVRFGANFGFRGHWR